MLRVLAVSDILFSHRLLPSKLRLYPALQVAQTEESVTLHILQLLAVHLLTVKLMIFWTDPDIPETIESMEKLLLVELETLGAAIVRTPVVESIDTNEGMEAPL